MFTLCYNREAQKLFNSAKQPQTFIRPVIEADPAVTS